MSKPDWRERAAAPFVCEKEPASACRGMVVTNHPLASAAAIEILTGGGNAIDAAVGAQFALTVVVPGSIGLIGGGITHLRLADGSHRIIDGMSSVPAAARPDMYRPIAGAPPEVYDAEGRENAVGPKSVATPGSLRAWCEVLRRFGTLPLAEVMQPAIRYAARGFTVTPYLHDSINDAAADFSNDKLIADRYMPGGSALPVGSKLVQADYAEALMFIAQQGEGALHGGALGDRLVECLAARGGIVSREDLTGYRPVERAPIRGTYRGWEIVGPPPPAASGVHIVQMLNILEAYDIRAMGFGSADAVHLLAEVLKIAFADRAAATADPDFVRVPIARLTSKDYAIERRSRIDPQRALRWGPGVGPAQSPHTTHLTVADAAGNVVASTQTINNSYGARFIVPGTGMIPNNYMVNFDPRPGNALSIQPGKRVTTSMAPVMALRNGRPMYALGLPGGKRIFPSVLQALINLIDHGMTAQEGVEAPRVWTEGPVLEVERGIPDSVREALTARGHVVQPVAAIAGGMSCIAFGDDGTMTGAACWRADGTPVGLGGGYARRGVRFRPEAARS